MTLPEERQFTLAEAERRALQDIGALGLTHRSQSLGTGPCAAWTELQDADGHLLTGGWGKGEQHAARTGALYEALEHLLTRRHAADNATVLAVDDLVSRMPPDATACLPGALLADQLEETIACRRYEDLHAGPGFHYPLALSAPDYVDAPLRDDSFDYTGLRRYASNSGTAIGASVDEALLHALNECIERDAISLFLLTHFFHARQAPLHVVSCDGLPANVADLYRRVAHLVEADITLLDISNGSGVTTCLAVSHRLYPHARPYGAGASLNPAHAARRALTELAQSHLGLSCGADAIRVAREEAPCLQARLQPWPRLQACLTMDVEQRLATQPLVPTVFADAPAGDVASQVRQIAALLGGHGLQVGFAVVHQTPVGTALVNVVVPTFERFHLVAIGNVVAPGQRGQALMAP